MNELAAFKPKSGKKIALKEAENILLYFSSSIIDQHAGEEIVWVLLIE